MSALQEQDEHKDSVVVPCNDSVPCVFLAKTVALWSAVVDAHHTTSGVRLLFLVHCGESSSDGGGPSAKSRAAPPDHSTWLRRAWQVASHAVLRVRASRQRARKPTPFSASIVVACCCCSCVFVHHMDALLGVFDVSQYSMVGAAPSPLDEDNTARTALQQQPARRERVTKATRLLVVAVSHPSLCVVSSALSDALARVGVGIRATTDACVSRGITLEPPSAPAQPADVSATVRVFWSTVCTVATCWVAVQLRARLVSPNTFEIHTASGQELMSGSAVSETELALLHAHVVFLSRRAALHSGWSSSSMPTEGQGPLSVTLRRLLSGSQAGIPLQAFLLCLRACDYHPQALGTFSPAALRRLSQVVRWSEPSVVAGLMCELYHVLAWGVLRDDTLPPVLRRLMKRASLDPHMSSTLHSLLPTQQFGWHGVSHVAPHVAPASIPPCPPGVRVASDATVVLRDSSMWTASSSFYARCVRAAQICLA